MIWTLSEVEALCQEVYESNGMAYDIYTGDALQRLQQRLDAFIADWDWNSAIEKSIVDGSYTQDMGDWDNEEYI